MLLLQGMPAVAQMDGGQIFTLENGLNVFIRPMRASPVVAVNFWIKSGSVNEAPGEEGYAHLLERMLFRGSTKFPLSALENEIKAVGARHSSFTANDYTSVAMVGGAVYFDRLLELLFETVFNSALDAKELAEEAKDVIKEIERIPANPNNHIVQLMMQEAFKVHPYKNPILGIKSNLEQITRNRLLEFYKKLYVPGNMWLIVTGDIEPEAALASIKKYAAGIPKAAVPVVRVQPEPPQNGLRLISEHADVQQTYIRMGWRVPGVESVDKYALYVVARMIGGGTSSWLWNELVESSQLASSAGAGYYSSQYPMLFQVGGVTTPGKARLFVEAARRVVYRLIDGEVSYDEIEAAKKQIIADDIFGRESAENQAANYGHFAILSDIRDSDLFVENIRAVNLEDIRRVAVEYFNDNNLTVARIDPEATPDNAAPEMITLDNGVRIILKENHSSPVVAVVVKVAAGGLREEKREGGLAYLTAEMLAKGTKNLSGSEIESTFAAMGSKYTAEVSKSFVAFSLHSLSENFQKSLELFLDILEKPDFAASELEKLKTRAEENIKSEESDIYAFASQQALTAIFPETPISYSNFGRIDDLKKFKRQNLVDFHEKHYVGGNIVVAVVGDFYTRELKDFLLANFGRFSGNSPKDFKFPDLKEIREPIAVELKVNMEQAQIIYANRTLPAADERNVALEVAQAILSGGVSPRLIRHLRDRDSLAFSSWAFNTGMANTGYFLAAAITSPARAAEAAKALRSEIELFKNSAQKSDELDQAKKYLIGKYSLSLTDNLSMAENFSSDELLGRGFDFYKRYPQLLASVTPELLQDVSQQYLLASGSYSMVTTVP